MSGPEAASWEAVAPQRPSTSPERTPRNSSIERVAASETNEQSPLLSPSRPEDHDSIAGFDASPLDGAQLEESIMSKSMWYLIALTANIGGLQIAWSVELSYGSPYLLSLGISKSIMALVWIAGPLSGVLVQPYVGIRSDNCRISWGKRKPFMAGGALATIISLMALAWTREIVAGFLGIFGVPAESQGVKLTIMMVAVLFIYVLDFSINTIQAGIRAFIVDNAPAHQQDSANAWAGRLTGLGNILGYLFGYTNLPKILPFFGNTQFKVLCVIASLFMAGTLAISMIFVTERDPRLDGPPPTEKGGVVQFFKQVSKSIGRLPPQIRKVCEVQFFAWIGWFPFLFYITTYIGQIYVNPIIAAKPDMTPEELSLLWEKATRIGTYALLIFAITSFAANILLPFIVAPSFSNPSDKRPLSSDESIHSTRAATSLVARCLKSIVIPWLTLRRAWLLSHVLFAICTWLTILVRSTAGATALVGIIGIPWAITLWAPFALISAEISKRDALRRSRRSSTTITGDANLEDQAGIILGLHNVAISAPQILATIGSSIIFKFLQKPMGSLGDESVGWVLRAGGIFALVAAYMTTRVGEEKDAGEDI
ncbi:MAG: hypothetical protein M1829_005054 [Trizodia sp. TS-e1964]|nr:MAG: hypothetical protein M1829_005054 [Trizodia sp. TS-e1964]